MNEPHGPASWEEQERLRDRYQEIAALAGGLAHEIRNPLSTMRLNLELLAEDFGEADGGPRERRALRKIIALQRECQRLQDVLEDFLNFAKTRNLQLEPRDLNQEIESVCEFYRAQADDAGIELIHYLASDLPPVLLDGEAFRGALLNLMINAQQAMPDGGQLMFRTAAADGEAQLVLIDNGVGMDEKTRGQVFDAFFSSKPTGTGLGLPTARKIIEAHGGSVSAQSEPGRGTQFTIRLPTADVADPVDQQNLQDETADDE
ncbi:MAG: ATP-binding protein [Planctomycetales bacterium]